MPEPPLGEGRRVRSKLSPSRRTMRMLTQRIGIFVNLPLDKLSKLSLQKQLEEIGRLRAGSPFRTTRLNRKRRPPSR